MSAIDALKKRLSAAAVPELAHGGLHEFIDEFQVGLGELHDRIASTYFIH